MFVCAEQRACAFFFARKRMRTRTTMAVRGADENVRVAGAAMCVLTATFSTAAWWCHSCGCDAATHPLWMRAVGSSPHVVFVSASTAWALV